MTPEAARETSLVPEAGTVVGAERVPLIMAYPGDPVGGLSAAPSVMGPSTLSRRSNTTTVAPANRVESKRPAAAQITTTMLAIIQNVFLPRRCAGRGS